jgi:hypothetical protein
MAQEWYVTMAGQQYGPVTPQQLREMAMSGQLQPTDSVWKQGMANWVPAKSIKGLPFNTAVAPAPAPAPTQPYAPAPEQAFAPGPAPVYQPTVTPKYAAAPASKNFRFDGRAGDFFVTALLAGLLAAFTLYIATPWAICMIQRWKAQHTIVQGRRLKFMGTGGALFGKFIVGMLLTMVTFGIYTFWFVPALQKWTIEHTDFEDA